MSKRLDGRTAIVTGGGGGIGAATVELFCREGAKVLIVDSNASALEETARGIRARVTGAEIAAFCADVSHPQQACEAVCVAVSTFGSVEILVNNAAIRARGSVEESAIEEWNRLLAVNLLGAVNFSKAALVELRKAGDASIVMLSSCFGVVGRAGWPIYDATKAALISLTRTLAIEQAPYGIRVNAVCPGGTLTPFTLARNMATGMTEKEVSNQARTDCLLRRWARPEEIAFPILWLASSEASFITGTTIMVDGGLSII